mmetsp:Transcript_12830/g.39482  ORF Transcript_12830/g.39482 Transcript_12830/m.39482 type:complete len:209 (-) Transcript_12830:1939-2565(-)
MSSSFLQLGLQFVENLRVIRGEQRPRRTLASGSTRSSYTVDVGLNLLRHLIVDHVVDVLDVNSAAQHIRSYKNTMLSHSEAVQIFFALLLVFSSVDDERTNVRLALDHARDCITTFFGVDKYDNGGLKRPQKRNKSSLLLRFTGQNLDLLFDKISRLALLSYRYGDRPTQKLPCKPLYSSGHSCRKHEGLSLNLSFSLVGFHVILSPH